MGSHFQALTVICVIKADLHKLKNINVYFLPIELETEDFLAPFYNLLSASSSQDEGNLDWGLEAPKFYYDQKSISGVFGRPQDCQVLNKVGKSHQKVFTGVIKTSNDRSRRDKIT